MSGAMATHGGVTVALPIFRAQPEDVHRSVSCIRAQTLRELEILVILNGADAPTTRTVRGIASQDPRVRIIERPRPGLAGALNEALRSAAHELVARMDVDDECSPERLALQARFMAESPRVVGVGSWFEGVEESGEPIGIVRPPTDPADLRWRLCLGNVLCHGSMMLRRGPVLEIGGYDEECRFGQDYDLWLRLSREHDLANLPAVLYRYRADLSRRHLEQAVIASSVMLESWSGLPELPEEGRARLAALLARATWGGQLARDSLAHTEALLRQYGPTREGLLAWQWIAQRAGEHWNPGDLQKLEAVRRLSDRLAAAGVREVWLYGAGRHTGWLLENLDALGVRIAGVADDGLAGASRWGLDVAAPAEIPAGAEVVLSSDAHEARLLAASVPLRERGSRVWCIYGSAEPQAGSVIAS